MVNTKKRASCNVERESTRPAKRSREAKAVSVIDKAAFKKRKESLSVSLWALQRTHKDDYDTQSEHMDQILSKIATWLPQVWTLMEAGNNLKLAASCISCCDTTLHEAWECESQVALHQQSTEIIINTVAGKTIFKTSHDMEGTLTWFWRELLVMDAITKRDPSDSLRVLDGLSRQAIADVYALIRSDDAKGSKGRDKYFDSHWTSTMRSAAKRILSSRADKRLAKFTKKPSLALYNALVNPDNQDSLLEVVRNEVAQGEDCRIPLDEVVEIYQKGGLVDEIAPLIPQIKDNSTLQTVAQALSDSEIWEHRKAGLKLIRSGIRTACREVMDELECQCPSLQAAQQWLKKEVFPKYKARSPSSKKLNAIVEQFVEIAKPPSPKPYSGGRDYETDFDDDCGDYDDYDDYDCDDYAENESDLSIDLVDWLRLLYGWPHQEESQGVWDSIKWKDGDDPYGLCGLTLALGRTCQSSRPLLSHTVTKIISRVFPCEDVQAIGKYLPKVSSGGSREYAGTVIMSTPWSRNTDYVSDSDSDASSGSSSDYY